MLCRERRSWTAQEDRLLRDAIELEDPGTNSPSKWHAIAKHVPGRTNKDCRKRWFAKMASDVIKGGWSAYEDEKLVAAIKKYGTRWSLVATMVQTRNSDQCAKRWTDTLNPTIDRTPWTSEADELLLQAVDHHGKVWSKIVRTTFPGRTGLSAKNRYNSITRGGTRASGSRPQARLVMPKGPSAPSSSSASTSPSPSPVHTPSVDSHFDDQLNAALFGSGWIPPQPGKSMDTSSFGLLMDSPNDTGPIRPPTFSADYASYERTNAFNQNAPLYAVDGFMEPPYAPQMTLPPSPVDFSTYQDVSSLRTQYAGLDYLSAGEHATEQQHWGALPPAPASRQGPLIQSAPTYHYF